MLLDRNDARLVLVDMQPRILQATADPEHALRNARILAKAAKLLGVSACVTEQNPSRLGPGDAEITAQVGDVFAKMSFSATGSDEFLAWLAQRGSAQADSSTQAGPAAAAGRPAPAGQLVLAGCETHICLLQTAMRLKERGHEVYVAADACGSRTQQNHAAGLARLAGAGCRVVTTEMVLFEWLGSAADPDFKAVQALIK